MKKEVKNHDSKKDVVSRKALYWNGGIAIVLFVAFLFISPRAANLIIFQGLVLNWPYLAIILIAIAMAYPFFAKGYLNDRTYEFKIPFLGRLNLRRSLVAGSFIALLASVSIVLMSRTTDYLTYKLLANFENRGALVASDPDRIRYTARKTAYRDIENSITAATEEVKFEYTHPLVTEDGFAYVSAITPDGVIPTLMSDNPGFVYYDDRADIDTKIKRIDQPQAYGLNEVWTDNFWWGVYHKDWWATYEDPHFLPLDPKNPEKLTAIVPKIKYRFWRLPYWGGILLVHDDGRIEDLTIDEAQKDKRLMGKWIAPIDLARDYVEHQNYAVGYWASFVRVAGKLEIDDVEGLNKFPFITRGADGRDYFVVATKAEGSGGGLFRMYYATADTFDLTVYEFDKAKTVYGPNAARNRVFNIQDWTWYRVDEGGGSSGLMTAIEPVYIVRPGDEDRLFWKFTITTKDFNGTAGSAVVNSTNPDSFKAFKSRNQFETWLRGTKSLHEEIIKKYESQTGQTAPEDLSLPDKIRWHANQIQKLTEEMQE